MKIDKQQLMGKIDQLVEKYADPAFPEDLDTIKEWKATVERAMISDSLKKHEGMKLIVKKIRNDLEEIDFILLNKTGLESVQRDMILTKKKMHEYYLSLLFPKDNDLKEIVDNIEKEL